MNFDLEERLLQDILKESDDLIRIFVSSIQTARGDNGKK